MSKRSVPIDSVPIDINSIILQLAFLILLLLYLIFGKFVHRTFLVLSSFWHYLFSRLFCHHLFRCFFPSFNPLFLSLFSCICNSTVIVKLCHCSCFNYFSFFWVCHYFIYQLHRFFYFWII